MATRLELKCIQCNLNIYQLLEIAYFSQVGSFARLSNNLITQLGLDQVSRLVNLRHSFLVRIGL